MKSPTDGYYEKKKLRLCVRCRAGLDTSEEKVTCRDCSIKNIWGIARSAAKDRCYAPIDMHQDDFVAWYKAKIIECAGMCEWCKEPFGKPGPQTDHDHETGQPRALLCRICNLTEGAGLKRLRLVVAALERWEIEKKIPDKPEWVKKEKEIRKFGLESSFARWKKFINGRAFGDREKRFVRTIDEMRSRAKNLEEFELCYDKFRTFLEE